MRPPVAIIFLSTLLGVGVEAVPHSYNLLVVRSSGNTTNSTTPASLPEKNPKNHMRADHISDRRKGFEYGPSLLGEASSFLNGSLGNERVKQDMWLWEQDRRAIEADLAADLGNVTAAIQTHGGLKSLDDYTNILYHNQWNKTITKLADGILTNYTNDLLFSMERLSQNPYPLKLVNKKDKLPFELDDDLAKKITGDKLSKIRDDGRLFVVDHKYQEKYDRTKKFGASCTAYFFIHPKSKDFLPLAIKTNVGKNLVYTPKDSANDWLLAKIMFNVNDLFDSQMNHLVATHDVAEPIHEAALRTLSDSHPVMVILERLMHQAYSARPVGEQQVFNPGGKWDENFLISNVGARKYVKDFYPTAGAFQKNYLENNLRTRGLIDNKDKSKFKSFPFLDDAKAVNEKFYAFFKTFVDSYYDKDKDAAKDSELQAWFVEATKEAKVIDFPNCGGKGKECNKKTLVEVLTHIAYLNAMHHTLNGGDSVGSKATLPFHPAALFTEVPDSKNISSVLPFLPPPSESVRYITFMAEFNRPFYESQKKTLAYAFSGQKMLKRLNKKTGDAAATYLKDMKKLSDDIRKRTFDKDGLCQGMPFCWKALDPGTMPYFMAV